MLKLNLGCGSVQPEGWVNVDYSLGARLTKLPLYTSINKKLKIFDKEPDGTVRDWSTTFIFNLNKQFPWSENSVDVIYTSHTLEHFSREEGRAILKQCFKVLKPGGILRIVVPDLKHFINEYTTGKMRADDFVNNLGVLYEIKDKDVKNLLTPITQFPHRCMYDTPALLSILAEIGFKAAEKGPFESNIADISSIEVQNRTINAVIVEAIKP